MKKNVLLVVAIASLALASCKKDYTCECTATGNGSTVTASTTIKDTKKKAKDACDGKASSSAGVTTSCAIK